MLSEDKKIKSKAQLKECLEYESKRYGKVFWLFALLQSGEKAILVRHQKLLRKTEYHVNNGHKLRSIVLKFLLTRLQTKYSLHIPLNTFEKGLKIMHLGPVLVNNGASIGQDCVLHMNTSIVAGGRSSKVPVLGKGVILGVGSVVLGDVQIADYVAIGANAVVNKSVEEPNVAVAGIPAKIISNHGSLEWNKDKAD